jgi:AcrR family transcriptional regulator
MPRPGKDRYHHGDLRAALIETAAELIAERGMRGFSLAETSRRLGVAVSAPYAHFKDRDDLLAAVWVRAFELFYAALVPATAEFSEPADRLAAMASAYVRFAAGNRPMFEVLYESGLDKSRHPEIEAAERPLDEAFESCVRALADGDDSLVDEMAVTFEATARGHAMLLLDGGSSPGDDAVELAAERAARATRALVESRSALVIPSRPGVQE